jgi:general secretion pathway protein D
LVLTDDGSTANDELAEVVDIVASARQSLQAERADLRIADLAVETLDLSYIEADRCLALLKVLGYQTVEYKTGGKGVGKSQIIQPSGKVDAGNLPVVISTPATAASNLVGESQIGGGAFGLSMTPSVASELPENTAAAPTMQLMVLYHPARPQQFSELKHRIHSRIDVPARQILIEAMVLEISQTGLTELGVEWELTSPFGSEPYDQVDTLKLGRLPSNLSATQSTLNVEIGDVLGHFQAKLRALVRTGEAEILSRPSVLTLDNRQASIRVGEDIPVATSVAGLRNNDKISFNFKYLPTGILLNVRPRVAPERNEVSMQIDGIVSAEVPGEQLEIRAQDGEEVLATAPRISTRRVQTYGRIANNTPFIIGGLVSRDRTSTKEKVPLLGDLPLVGGLFRNETTDTLKREVIIVITPYVLPDNKVVGRNMPKDEDMFDSFGNRLFRDAYRIRAEDVFDLSFLHENQPLQRMSERAEQAVRRNFRLAERYPFNRFVGGRIPGERILVYRQMYEVIKRLGIDDRIEPIALRGGVRADPMIFFKPDRASLSGFKVRFLWPYLMQETGVEVDDQHARPNAVYRWLQDHGKALALTYTRRQTSEPKEVLAHPVPETRLVDCADREAWDRLLSELNTRDEQGRQRFTILIRSADDWSRLKRATVLKQVVQLNANAKALSLDNFSIGRLLLMPTIHEDKVYLIDGQTAKYFYYTEQYYAALEKELAADVEALEAALTHPAVRVGLDEDPPDGGVDLNLDRPDDPR